MDERKIRILEAIIRDYVETGEPVGSRTLAKKYDLGVSSATIRNEMSDLEELGYIEQLHTSSGRIPSDKGYRLYVDELMKIQGLTPEEEYIIKNRLLTAALFEVDKMVKEATMILSKLTQLACIVKAPSVRKSFIKHIQLIGIDKNSILSIIITDSGIIKNDILRINKPIENEMLTRLSHMLTVRLYGLTVEDMDLEVINNLKEDLRGYDDIFSALIPVLYESLKSIEPSKVYSQGTTNIFNYIEYNDIQKAKEFLNFINDEGNIRNILNNKDCDKKLTIRIGAENILEGARDCSIITAEYSIEDRTLGSIGVIGPTRIHYDKVISVLNGIVSQLNKNILDIYNGNR